MYVIIYKTLTNRNKIIPEPLEGLHENSIACRNNKSTSDLKFQRLGCSKPVSWSSMAVLCEPSRI